MNMKPILLLFALQLTSCQLVDQESTLVKQAAENWAEAYFHFDYQQAAQHTTAEGLRWLQFAASNINEADLDVINQYVNDISISVSDVYVGNDTMAVAAIHVNHWFSPDSIGHAGSMKDDGVFDVELVKRDGAWKVRMACLPQSGMQSHD
jgi:hypothetical protein